MIRKFLSSALFSLFFVLPAILQADNQRAMEQLTKVHSLPNPESKWWGAFMVTMMGLQGEPDVLSQDDRDVISRFNISELNVAAVQTAIFEACDKYQLTKGNPKAIRGLAGRWQRIDDVGHEQRWKFAQLWLSRLSSEGRELVEKTIAKTIDGSVGSSSRTNWPALASDAPEVAYDTIANACANRPNATPPKAVIVRDPPPLEKRKPHPFKKIGDTATQFPLTEEQMRALERMNQQDQE